MDRTVLLFLASTPVSPEITMYLRAPLPVKNCWIFATPCLRVANIRQNPRVSFNLDGNRLGGDVVVIEGTALIDESALSVDENPEYLDKYGEVMAERDWSPEWFAERYPVYIRVKPTRFRYW